MKIKFGGVPEDVVTRKEYPLAKAKETLADEIIAVLGYGRQGRGQGLNLRDNGFNVIVGQRPGESYDAAVRDGWIPDDTLFSMEEAADQGSMIAYLLTDAGQKQNWPAVKQHLEEGNALIFSHGFSIVYKDQTGVIPPKNVDVLIVAPKGAGSTVRANYLNGSGINSSFGVYQDATGRALDRVKAYGIAVGSGFLFPTTFEKEVYSDLTGERGVLMGALAGIMKAQYDCLREHGHSPSEAFNETVEEATQSLVPLVSKNGMDWMFENCSETARIGALRWMKRFGDVAKPLFDSLYDLVACGEETRIVLETSKDPDYKQKLSQELKKMRDSEMWRAGATVRSLRPENQKK